MPIQNAFCKGLEHDHRLYLDQPGGLTNKSTYEFILVALDSNDFPSLPSNLKSVRIDDGSEIPEEISDSPAVILAQYLRDAGLFVDPDESGDWPLYIASTPDGKNIQDDVGTVYDTTGVKDGRLMAGQNIFHYGIQIRIRCVVYTEGYTKAKTVAANLSTLRSEEVVLEGNTYQIKNAQATSAIIPLGNEPGSKRRELLTMNYLLTLKIIDN